MLECVSQLTTEFSDLFRTFLVLSSNEFVEKRFEHIVSGPSRGLDDWVTLVLIFGKKKVFMIELIQKKRVIALIIIIIPNESMVLMITLIIQKQNVFGATIRSHMSIPVYGMWPSSVHRQRFQRVVETPSPMTRIQRKQQIEAKGSCFADCEENCDDASTKL